MKRVEKSLAELFRELTAKRTEESRARCLARDRENRRCVFRLAARGVTTVPELVVALPGLPPKLKEFGIWWIQQNKVRGAETVLLRMLRGDPQFHLSCASALAMIGGTRSTREFLKIGRAQLASPKPDRHWLDAVIVGFKMRGRISSEAEELLLMIYERTDLPGWLRGDAGDALGCCSQLRDRRTTFFRRALTTARNGLHEADIEVQFWSMYLIMQLAQTYSSKPSRSNSRFSIVLPQLRKIAAEDHRLAPGYWWPMSAEAEDAIHVIENGNGPEVDAADRWHGNTERGPMIRG